MDLYLSHCDPGLISSNSWPCDYCSFAWLKKRVNYNSFIEKVKNKENDTAPHKSVLKKIFSAKPHLYLLGFTRSQCTCTCQICGCILLLNKTNWYAYTSRLCERKSTKWQDSKEMYENENTVVWSQKQWDSGRFFSQKSHLVITTEKLLKNDTKASFQLRMLNLNWDVYVLRTGFSLSSITHRSQWDFKSCFLKHH